MGETETYGSLRVLDLHGRLDFDYVQETSKVPKKRYQAINFKWKGVNVKTTPSLTQPLWWEQRGWPTKCSPEKARAFFHLQMTFNVIKFFNLLYPEHSISSREPILIYTLPVHLNTSQCWKLNYSDKAFNSLLLAPPCRPIPGKRAFLDASANSLGLSSKSQLLFDWLWTSWSHPPIWAPNSWDQALAWFKSWVS